jgi:hypothetical protein
MASLWDETAPTVALMKSGPAGKIPLRSRGTIKMFEPSSKKGVTVMIGTLVQYSHDIGDDSATGMVFDDRWWMSKITVTGRFIYDPVKGKFTFDGGQRLVFNERGMPNCIDAPNGLVCFAPTDRFGYSQSFSTADYDEPKPGQATDRARSWTCGDALRYLRQCHSRGLHNDVSSVSLGRTTLPSFIEWPETVSQVIGNSRVLNNVSLENNSLLQAFTTICRKTGAYDLYMTPGQDDRSIITILNMNPRDKAGGQVCFPKYVSADIAALMNDPTVVLGGTVNESIINMFDSVAICGDPPAVERMFSMATTGAGASYLIKAWTDADEASFKSYMADTAVTATRPNTRARFVAACDLWPYVYAAYRVNDAVKDLFSGTVWETTGVIAYRPKILPTALTGYQESSSQPRNWEKRQIIVEVNYRNTGDWIPCQRLDSASLTPNREIIFLTGLRDVEGSTYYATPAGTYVGSTFTAAEMRINMAAEGDWRITALTPESEDPNGIGDRVDKAEDLRTTYLSVSEPGDYVDYTRIDSYPSGLAQQDPAKRAVFVDKNGKGGTPSDYLFTDFPSDSLPDSGDTTGWRLNRHAAVRLADVKRVEYSGSVQFSGLNISVQPGSNLSIQSTSPIPAYGVVKALHLDPMTQTSVAEFSAYDQRVIYDIPVPRHMPTTEDRKNKTGAKDTGTPAGMDMETLTSFPAPGIMLEGSIRDSQNTADEIQRASGPMGTDWLINKDTPAGGSKPQSRTIRGKDEIEKSAELARLVGNPQAGIFTEQDMKYDAQDRQARFNKEQGRFQTYEELGMEPGAIEARRRSIAEASETSRMAKKAKKILSTSPKDE